MGWRRRRRGLGGGSWINVGLCRIQGRHGAEIRKSRDSGDFSPLKGKSTPSKIKTWRWCWSAVSLSLIAVHKNTWLVWCLSLYITKSYYIYKSVGDLTTIIKSITIIGIFLISKSNLSFCNRAPGLTTSLLLGKHAPRDLFNEWLFSMTDYQ